MKTMYEITSITSQKDRTYNCIGENTANTIISNFINNSAIDEIHIRKIPLYENLSDLPMPPPITMK